MWSKDIPKQSGIYFFRYGPNEDCFVVEYDDEYKWVREIGSDVPLELSDECWADVEFWTEPVQFPPNDQNQS